MPSELTGFAVEDELCVRTEVLDVASTRGREDEHLIKRDPLVSFGASGLDEIGKQLVEHVSSGSGGEQSLHRGPLRVGDLCDDVRKRVRGRGHGMMYTNGEWRPTRLQRPGS